MNYDVRLSLRARAHQTLYTQLFVTVTFLINSTTDPHIGMHRGYDHETAMPHAVSRFNILRGSCVLYFIFNSRGSFPRPPSCMPPPRDELWLGGSHLNTLWKLIIQLLKGLHLFYSFIYLVIVITLVSAIFRRVVFNRWMPNSSSLFRFPFQCEQINSIKPLLLEFVYTNDKILHNNRYKTRLSFYCFIYDK